MSGAAARGVMAVVMLAGWTMAAAQPAREVPKPFGPVDATAEDAVERVIAKGAFGPVETQPQSATLLLELNGDRVDSGTLYLVEPNAPVRLRATLQTRAQEPVAPGEFETGVFRQSQLTEVVWTAEPEDFLSPGGDGTVVWRAGKPDGAPSIVNASIATLTVARSAEAIAAAAADQAVTAPLASAESHVVLLAGVSFDRSGDGVLNGVNIGVYPNESGGRAPASVRDRAELYRPPAVVYRLDVRSASARVTPSLTLGDLNPPLFAEEGDGVRYVALSPRLRRFLLAFEENLKEKNLDPANLRVLRGFVSPTERLRLERQGEKLAEFSRHQYGDAVVLVYDTAPRGAAAPHMVDLNGDSKVNVLDAEALGDIAKATMDELQMFGGLGIGAHYATGPSKGTPYVHVDLRGFYSPFREE